MNINHLTITRVCNGYVVNIYHSGSIISTSVFRTNEEIADDLDDLLNALKEPELVYGPQCKQ